ncbi:hypothetical protein PR048_030547 [Dryococelus australis]|uniref:Uncharacterized protein n=1 Tax=Dryococelus australis TaxID=614101 RepID=A0ABQ9G9B6_9NEOP|nr:hypothetical protein PR048_030547 [Dryococelus australis]
MYIIKKQQEDGNWTKGRIWKGLKKYSLYREQPITGVLRLQKCKYQKCKEWKNDNTLIVFATEFCSERCRTISAATGLWQRDIVRMASLDTECYELILGLNTPRRVSPLNAPKLSAAARLPHAEAPFVPCHREGSNPMQVRNIAGMKGRGETGDARENPADQRDRPALFPRAKIRDLSRQRLLNTRRNINANVVCGGRGHNVALTVWCYVEGRASDSCRFKLITSEKNSGTLRENRVSNSRTKSRATPNRKNTYPAGVKHSSLRMACRPAQRTLLTELRYQRCATKHCGNWRWVALDSELLFSGDQPETATAPSATERDNETTSVAFNNRIEKAYLFFLRARNNLNRSDASHTSLLYSRLFETRLTSERLDSFERPSTGRRGTCELALWNGLVRHVTSLLDGIWPSVSASLSFCARIHLTLTSRFRLFKKSSSRCGCTRKGCSRHMWQAPSKVGTDGEKVISYLNVELKVLVMTSPKRHKRRHFRLRKSDGFSFHQTFENWTGYKIDLMFDGLSQSESCTKKWTSRNLKQLTIAGNEAVHGKMSNSESPAYDLLVCEAASAHDDPIKASTNCIHLNLNLIESSALGAGRGVPRARRRFAEFPLTPCRLESCRTMPLTGGFSRGSPVALALAFRALLHSHIDSPSSALKTSLFSAPETFARNFFFLPQWVVTRGADITCAGHARPITTCDGALPPSPSKNFLLSHLTDNEGTCTEVGLHSSLITCERRNCRSPPPNPRVNCAGAAFSTMWAGCTRADNVRCGAAFSTMWAGCTRADNVRCGAAFSTMWAGCTRADNVRCGAAFSTMWAGCTRADNVRCGAAFSTMWAGCTRADNVRAGAAFSTMWAGCTRADNVRCGAANAFHEGLYYMYPAVYRRYVALAAIDDRYLPASGDTHRAAI